MGLFVSLLRPFARGQQAGGFNLAITSLQRWRKVPWGPTCQPACLPASLPCPLVRSSACPSGPGNSNRREAIVDMADL